MPRLVGQTADPPGSKDIRALRAVRVMLSCKMHDIDCKLQLDDCVLHGWEGKLRAGVRLDEEIVYYWLLNKSLRNHDGGAMLGRASKDRRNKQHGLPRFGAA